MTKHASGLRFDIYERVRLAEDLDGIEYIDDVELTPQITLESRGDQVVLKGNLVLHGNFTGTRDGQSRFEHRIPVEIFMPAERIERPENVGVEIEHFDIDLLSKRMLNVTGVLTLKGISDSAGIVATPEWSEQEKLFVHKAPSAPMEGEFETSETRDAEGGNESSAASTARDDEDTSPDSGIDDSSAESPSASAEESSADENYADESSGDDDDSTVEDESKSGEMKISFSGKKTDNDFPLQAADVQELMQREDEQASDARPAREERLEFAEPTSVSDKAEDEGETNFREAESGDLSTAVTAVTEQTETSGAASASESGEEEGESEEAAVSGVQWKHLFLSRETDEQRFRKVRMCIVQREETLETIAARYELNPREILLYNRLGDQQRLTEGQVLYIPDA